MGIGRVFCKECKSDLFKVYVTGRKVEFVCQNKIVVINKNKRKEIKICGSVHTIYQGPLTVTFDRKIEIPTQEE
jgi:hypothetical protein